MADIQIQTKSNHLYIPPVLSLIENYARSKNFNEGDIKKISIATEEAITNVIKHSYHGKKDKILLVELDFVDESLSINIKHKGDKFSLSEDEIKVDIDKILKEKRKGGFGLYIIKKFTDYLEIGEKGEWSYYLLKKKRK